MKDLLWNGKMDYDWTELSKFLMESSHRFAEGMLNTVQFSPNSESKELISSQCMKRFESIVGILANIIKDGDCYACEALYGEEQNALKLNSWVLLGSLTETVLQMFLAFYIDDYKKTQWEQWIAFEKEKVQNPLFECITKLTDEGSLDLQQAKSIKNAIKDKIKEHTKEHSVQKVMLDELIQLYQFLELFSEDEISYLRNIQANRNGIHSFQQRELGNWNDLQYSVRFFCYLLDWVSYNLPDIPDYD